MSPSAHEFNSNTLFCDPTLFNSGPVSRYCDLTKHRSVQTSGRQIYITGSGHDMTEGDDGFSLDERTRLAALRSYEILDTPAEAVFTEFARLAASITGAPTALISLIDGRRQWFKAKVGLAAR